jgi:hypothetical protein
MAQVAGHLLSMDPVVLVDLLLSMDQVGPLNNMVLEDLLHNMDQVDPLNNMDLDPSHLRDTLDHTDMDRDLTAAM